MHLFIMHSCNYVIEGVKSSIKSSIISSLFSDNLHLLGKRMRKYLLFNVIVLDAVICKQYSSVAQ